MIYHISDCDNKHLEPAYFDSVQLVSSQSDMKNISSFDLLLSNSDFLEENSELLKSFHSLSNPIIQYKKAQRNALRQHPSNFTEIIYYEDKYLRKKFLNEEKRLFKELQKKEQFTSIFAELPQTLFVINEKNTIIFQTKKGRTEFKHIAQIAVFFNIEKKSFLEMLKSARSQKSLNLPQFNAWLTQDNDLIIQEKNLEKGRLNKVFKFEKDNREYSIFNELSDFIFVLDEDFCIRHCNSAVFNHFKSDSESLKAAHIIQLASLTDRHKMLLELRRFKKEAEFRFDIRLKNSEKGFAWYSIQVKKINEERILLSARHNSDEKRIKEDLGIHINHLQERLDFQEMELNKARREYKTLIDSALDIIFTLSMDFTVKQMNIAGLFLVGFSEEDVQGKGVESTFPTSFHHFLKRAFNRIVEYQQSSIDEHELEFGQDILYFQTALSPVFNQQGKIIEVLGITRDISAKKEMEKELDMERQNLIQSSKMAAIGELATGIAHEINQPLNHIRMSASMNEMELEKDDIERAKVQERNRFILDDIERSTKIIQHLRNFGRRSDQDPFEKLNIHELIEASSLLFMDSLNSANIQMKKEFHSEHPFFYGNQNLFEQVLLNLISNARDAMKESARKELIVRSFTSKSRLILEFEDSGSGIPEDLLDKIFDPFFTTKEVGKGTGIGLSISYQIIQSFDGIIRAKNGETEGAIFQIILPEISQ